MDANVMAHRRGARAGPPVASPLASPDPIGDHRAMARRAKTSERGWAAGCVALLAALTALRLALDATGLVPVHFDEAQYWTYAARPDLGYYSKPPLVAWMIAAQTALLGDNAFALRVSAPLIHMWIAWLIFASARRLHDGRTGFWAAAGYALAPGVTVSSALMTTDPPMMLGWALALYALTRILTARRGRAAAEPWGWWLGLGLALGLGTLAKYTALVFVAGALGYAALSRESPLRPKGALVAAAGWLSLTAPHLVWLATHGFVSVAHLAENADQGRAGFTPAGGAEFLLSQAGVIGPVFLFAMAGAALRRGDWRWRILMWLTWPLLGAMAVQALAGGANANWAAPSYIAGSILAARWLVTRGWARALRLQLATGLAAIFLVWGLAFVYDGWGRGLPRVADPFKKMRIGPALCERVAMAMEETGIDIILSDDRRRLAECAWFAGLGPDRIRLWNPDGRIDNHYAMTASLAPGETQPMILFMLRGRADAAAGRFAEAEAIDTGTLATHADFAFDYGIWRVAGFRGYRD
ncbi:MAG: glycosyl transferase [Paracoccaceae bacterium]|nr:MAG: glycosyl transferase [Paracoccaceae bacterium]